MYIYYIYKNLHIIDKYIKFILYIIYVETIKDNLTQINDCKNLNVEENYFFNNAICIQIFFKEAIKKINKENTYYINIELINLIINMFVIKLIKIKQLKNYNQLLLDLNLNSEEVDFLVELLSTELQKNLKNNTYKSELLFKLNLSIISLFFLIFVNNQSEVKDYLELNVFSTFSIKNLNFFIKNLTEELLLDKENNYKLWYVILYIDKISSNLNIFTKNNYYFNIFFQFYFENLNVEKLKDVLTIYINNIAILTNSTQKYVRKNKNSNVSLLNNLNKNNDNSVDPLKLKLFLIEFLSKKYNIFLKNICSQQLSYINDISFFLTKLNLFYENKLIVEFGYKYWSNSSLNLSYLKKQIYNKVLLNTKNLNLEFDFENNMLINVFFKNKKFYIKKNVYGVDNSIFDFQKLKIINNKLKKKVYYTDITIFLELFYFFEKFLLKTNFEKNIKTLKACILFFEENIEKINNFNFFNIETISKEEEEKYLTFFTIFNLFVWTYKEYVNKIIISTEFLNYFYKKIDIEELLNCIIQEEKNLANVFNDFLDFEKLNYTVKIIKNLMLFLNNTTEVNIKDVSNNKYDSKYFLEIEYCEYIIFLNKFKILISYLEQIITIFNLKQKIVENNLNKNKLFGIEIKLDFRGRLYSIDIVKAYDNNKLLRQSIKIKNTIKIKKLLIWYSDLYKKLNIDLSSFLKNDTYKFILEQKEFNKFSYLFSLSITNINKKDFLNLLYLKASIATLSYIGFLLLNSEKKKTYSMLEILKQGYAFFYEKNFLKIIDDLKMKYLNLSLNISIENYLELVETVNSLILINKDINFNILLLNNKLLSLDSSCNGYTHLLYTFSELNEEKFKQFKKVLNLSNDDTNYDFYSEVLNEIKESNSFLKEQIENKIINRNSIKKIVMTIPYNAKEYSFYEKLRSEVLEKDKKKKRRNNKKSSNIFF